MASVIFWDRSRVPQSWDDMTHCSFVIGCQPMVVTFQSVKDKEVFVLQIYSFPKLFCVQQNFFAVSSTETMVVTTKFVHCFTLNLGRRAEQRLRVVKDRRNRILFTSEYNKSHKRNT